uniref:General transcription factor IIH subunit 3 n=1 Tax=Caenorhabditis tropicalis TaxID=1561998 RepID=A0A1I7SYL6_9PELO
MTSRAVVISMTQIMGSEHGSLMNLFFSAAKQCICVDVVSMGDDSTGGILQQAADITGGSFSHAQKPHDLLKILMTNMLTDPSYRTAFSKLSHSSVDYRASCACHHTLVSSGWVCSICLSVLCQYTPICKVCRAAFTITNLPKNQIGSGLLNHEFSLKNRCVLFSTGSVFVE